MLQIDIFKNEEFRKKCLVQEILNGIGEELDDGLTNWPTQALLKLKDDEELQNCETGELICKILNSLHKPSRSTNSVEI